MTSPGPLPNTPSATQPRGLAVSAYDRSAAMLVSLLLLAGASVLMLFVVWLTNTVWVKPVAVEPELIEPLAGGGPGDESQLEEPGEDELEDLTDPELSETLDAVSDIVSTQRAALDSLDAHSPTPSRGGGGGNRNGVGRGEGDANLIPRWERWEILYSARNLTEYARQLDHFGVELAAIGGDQPQVDYARNLAQRQPDRRRDPVSEEDRLYMTWRYGPLREADKNLLKRAGIPTDGRITVQFYPANIENRLAILERDYLKTKKMNLADVAKTTFGVRSNAGAYAFFVKDVKRR